MNKLYFIVFPTSTFPVSYYKYSYVEIVIRSYAERHFL